MLQIRRMGCNSKHNKNFHINRPSGYDCFLLLLTHTPAYFYFSNTKIVLPANSIVLFDPYTPQRYGAVNSIYSDDWIQFEASNIEYILSNLQKNTGISLSDISSFCSYTQLIAAEFFEIPTSKAVVSDLLLALLKKIQSVSNSQQNFVPYSSDLIELRREIYSNPGNNWTVDTMSKRIGVSPSYLHTIYKKMFHISCINDVIHSRMELCCQLLEDTRLPVQDISILCGYSTYEHFLRTFRKAKGTSPLRYRKHHWNQYI